MPPAGFEPTISVSEQPPTYTLDCAATGTGNGIIRLYNNGGRYNAGVQNLGILSAGRNPAPLARKSKEKNRTLWKEVLHFVAAVCVAIKRYYCLYYL